MKQNNNTSPREDLEAKKWQQVQSTDQESQIQNDLCTPVARSSQLRTRAVLKKVLFFFFFLILPAWPLHCSLWTLSSCDSWASLVMVLRL